MSTTGDNGRNPTPDEIEAMSAPQSPPPVTGDATDTIHALMRSLMQDKPSGKVSRSWMYAAIRHSDRNCEFEKENDGDALSRYDGEIIADILNILADKSCIMMTEAPCCIMMTEAP